MHCTWHSWLFLSYSFQWCPEGTSHHIIGCFVNNSSKRTILPKQWYTLECKKDTPQCVIHFPHVPLHSAVVLKLTWRWIICSPSHLKKCPMVPGTTLSHTKWLELESYQLDMDEYLFCTKFCKPLSIPCLEIIIFIIIDFRYILAGPALDWTFGMWQLLVHFIWPQLSLSSFVIVPWV